MDCDFFDDCGLEVHDNLSSEIDLVRRDYFTSIWNTNRHHLDPDNSSDSEASETAVDETPVQSTADLESTQNTGDTPMG